MAFDHDDASVVRYGCVVCVNHRTRGGLVTRQIGAQLIQPRFAFLECGQRGSHGEGVRFGHFVGVKRTPHLMA